MYEFRLKCHWNLFLRVQKQYPSIGSDNGLEPARQQAIIWTNDGIFYWLVNASLGFSELKDPKSVHNWHPIACPWGLSYGVNVMQWFSQDWVQLYIHIMIWKDSQKFNFCHASELFFKLRIYRQKFPKRSNGLFIYLYFQVNWGKAGA